MTHHINPRFRAYGKARLDIARRARSPEEWARLWKPTMHPFAFQWGRRWKHCIEYRVEDFAAEVGFFLDVLGFPVQAFDEKYAMFTSPDEAFHLAVLPADERHPPTPPDALRLQFMVNALESTVEELRRRGVKFALPPQALRPGSSMFIAVFHTPHGLPVELWCEKNAAPQPDLAPRFGEEESPQTENLPLAAAPSPQAAESPAQQRERSAPVQAEASEGPSRSPSAAPPSRASRIVIRERKRRPPRRSNRLPTRFTPVPTVPRPAQTAPPQPEPVEPEYEDLPEALYTDDLP